MSRWEREMAKRSLAARLLGLGEKVYLSDLNAGTQGLPPVTSSRRQIRQMTTEQGCNSQHEHRGVTWFCKDERPVHRGKHHDAYGNSWS